MVVGLKELVRQQWHLPEYRWATKRSNPISPNWVTLNRALLAQRGPHMEAILNPQKIEGKVHPYDVGPK